MLKDNALARKRDIILKVIIVVFGFMLYANTLGHGYALDDTVTIWKNEFTQQGFAGIKDILSYDTMAGMFGKDMDEVAGGRYRPLSVVMFAIELEIFGKKTEAPDFSGDIVAAPFVGHFFNVIYYCLLLLLMYHVLKKLFRNHKPRYWFLSIPFLTVMLFGCLLHIRFIPRWLPISRAVTRLWRSSSDCWHWTAQSSSWKREI